MSYYDSASNASTTFKLPDGSDFITRIAYSVAQSHGVITLIVVSCFSLIAVIGLLSAIALSAFNTRKSKSPNMFVRTNVVAYFISLLVCDILQAIGSIMNATWVRDMAVSSGSLCTAQGMIKHVADVGIAMWSLIIAIHTFLVLFAKLPLKRYAMWCTLVSGWSAVAAIVIAGPATLDRNKLGPYYGVSGEWCWITGKYNVQRIALDYLIMFLSALFSLVLYAAIFYRLRGKILARPPSGIRPSEKERQVNYDTLLAKQMLLYPTAYIITILPIAAARFSAWSGHDVPFGVTIFSDTIYLLFGVVNTVLFVSTRRILPPRSIIPKFLISQPELIQSTAVAGDDYYDPYYEGAGSLEAAGEKQSAASENPFSSPEDRGASSLSSNGVSNTPPALNLSSTSLASPGAERLTDAAVLKHVHSPDSGSDRPSPAGTLSPMSDFDDVDIEDAENEGVRPMGHSVALPPVPPLAPRRPDAHYNAESSEAAGSKGKRPVSATPTSVMEYYYEEN